MEITCPKCGEVITVGSGHPPRLDIPVTTLCDTLAMSKDVLTAAQILKCSWAYIYRELKKVGKKPRDYLSG
jgi:hypothetical protein